MGSRTDHPFGSRPVAAAEREYWRGIEEWTDGAGPGMGAEFPPGVHDPVGGLSRRHFLKLLGASLALAGTGACVEPPRERILPYTVRPPEVTPGTSRYYATTMMLGGFGTGLLVESREGRPIKIEGNPEHPASLGATGVFEQASVLQLYDPDRARGIRFRGEPRTWLQFAEEFGPAPETPRVEARNAPRTGMETGPGAGARSGMDIGTPSAGVRTSQSTGTSDGGAGLRFLLEPTASPLTAELIARIREGNPAARFYFHAPLSPPDALQGARLAFGSPLQPIYDLSAADVILSLDADFLAAGPFSLRYARAYADRRRDPAAGMNRLHVAESTLTGTGGSADHRLRVRTGEIQALLEAVLAGVASTNAASSAGLPEIVASALEAGGARTLSDDAGRWVAAVARDLVAHAGAGVVIPGERQPPAVHALAHALNTVLGNVGRTVRFTESPLVDAGAPSHSIEELAREMAAGAVQTLVILGGNPVYTAPVDLEFGRLLRSIPRTVYLGLYENETARSCDWFLPELHYLESWGDARAYDGTASLVQPLIAPLNAGSSVDDVLAVFLGRAGEGSHAILRESWRGRMGQAGFDEFWDEALRRGVIPDTALPTVVATPEWQAVAALVARSSGELSLRTEADATSPGPGLEVTFREDPTIYDGRFANNPWLQELPDPVTKLTWDNAALLSPRTARRLEVDSEDLIEVGYGGRTLEIPVLVMPGHADDALTLPLGYGRSGEESVARGVGVNAYAIRTSSAPLYGTGASVRRVARHGESVKHRLARTQMHGTMEGRPIVLQATLEEYRANPDFTRSRRGRALSLYRPVVYTGDQWAMTIDLGVCTGCSACVVACQAENNTPVVGKEGVLKGREMHWLRIDRYFTGEPDDPGTLTQPMLCQHCEKAPCEYVCPVNATVHSPDGLNEMVYNRCVGTRFCSNNCPYKVRRFNWFDYNAVKSESERMQLNPDVTVRERGVMEKCTYCVQRIRRAQIQAQLEGRPVGGDEVWTACQQACPTRAIVFGSLGDEASAVSRTRRDPRLYSVLHDLGTEPRTQYLARITNPNPEQVEAETIASQPE